MSERVPEPSVDDSPEDAEIDGGDYGLPMRLRSAFLCCPYCGDEDVTLTVWGEGIDSSIECHECGEKEIYR